MIELVTTPQDLLAQGPSDAPLLAVAAFAAATPEGDDATQAQEGREPRPPELTASARAILGDDGAELLRGLGFAAGEAATVRLVGPSGPAQGRAVLVVDRKSVG
jgi:hypothetical protein